MKNLSALAAAKKPVVINEVMYWFAFDSMGEFAFNQDFGMMERQEWHFAVKLFRRALSIVGPFASTIWLMKIGFSYLPWFWKIGDWFSMLAFCNQQMQTRMKVRRPLLDTRVTLLDYVSDSRNRQDPKRKTSHLSSLRTPTRKDIARLRRIGSKVTQQQL